MKNGKKPAGQQSNQPNGDAVDLETELDGDEGAGGSDSDDDEDDDAEEPEGSNGGSASIQSQIATAVAAAVKKVEQKFNAETDRRVNQALAKQRKKLGVDDEDEDDDEEQQPKSKRQVRPAANVRAARLAFREELGEHIKILGPDERQLANEIGQSMIRSRALDGFEDPDEVGEQVAVETAELLNKARDFYSARTKRVLQKSGALQAQPSGQSSNGGQQPAGTQDAYEKAREVDKRLHPERYADEN